DVDYDRDVDLDDYTSFEACMSVLTGPIPLPEPPPPGSFERSCLNSFDFDHDSDIDLTDAGVFQSVFTGE
ncbi:MAG: hypothetical protein ACYTFA_19020, partial [Planctomycetota bacterium]